MSTAWNLSLGVILIGLGAWFLLGWDDTDTASAAHGCQTSTVCLGDAGLEIGNNPQTTYWRGCFRTENTGGGAGVCDITTSSHISIDVQDRASWQLDAGACITLYYYRSTSGATPPIPDTVTLQVRYDTTATVVITYVNNGAEPASGSTYTFCATTDGTSGGTARAGTFRLHLAAVRDDLVFPYSASTDTTTDTACAGAGSMCNVRKGAVRSNIKIADCTRSAYPAGSTFAYGPAGDEQVTLTVTGTQRFADTNGELVDVDILRNSDSGVIVAGATQEMNAGSAAEAATIDTTFDSASTSYDCQLEIRGGSGLIAGLGWTTCATTGHGSGVTCTAGTLFAKKLNVFTADPRIIFDADGSGTFATADDAEVTRTGSSTGPLAETFVRGEVVYYETFIFNARSEKLSRSMTFAVRNSASSTENSQSLSPSSNKYSTTYTVGATDALDAKKLRVSNADQLRDTPATVWTVGAGSLQIDGDGAGSPDNQPVCTHSVYNRVESVTCEYFVMGGSGPTPVDDVSSVVKASDGATENTQTLDPVSNKYTHTYTTGSTHKAVADTTGDDHKFTVTAGGTTINSVSRVFGLSSLYFLDAHIESDTTLTPDDFPTEDANEDMTYHISNDLTDTTSGWCHVKNVRKDTNIDTSGSAVTRAYVDPAAATRQTQNTDTGSDGWTSTRLDQLASTPLGTWHFTCSVTFNGNTGTDDESFTVGVLGGGGGAAAGDPLRIDVSCKRCYPGDSVLLMASESNADGSARTGNNAGTLFFVVNPSGTAVVNGATGTEQGYGGYYYTYSLGGSPATGIWKVGVRTTDAAPVGSWNTFVVVADDYASVVSQVNAHTTSTVNAARDRVVDHVDYTSGRVNLTRADIAAFKADFYTAWARLNTTCQKTTTADCEGLQASLEYQFTLTNSYINATATWPDFQLQFYQMWGRLNTTCQKAGTDGCEGLEDAITDAYDGLYGLVVYRSGQTNGYVNATSATLQGEHATQGLYAHCRSTSVQGDCEGVRANLTQVHAHVDAHFMDVLAAIDCDEGGNCTFIVNNTAVLNELEEQKMQIPGLSSPESWAVMILLALVVLSYFAGWLASFWGSNLGVILTYMAALTDVGEIQYYVSFGILFFLLGLCLEGFTDYRGWKMLQWMTVAERKPRRA